MDTLGLVLWLVALLLGLGSTVAGVAVSILWPDRKRLGYALLALGVLLILAGLAVAAWFWLSLGLCEIVSGSCALATVALLAWLLFSHRLRRARKHRRASVTENLSAYLRELDQLFEKAKDRLDADEILKPWKRDALKYLDANFSYDAVEALAGMRTGRNLKTQPSGHIEYSYQEHRRFLEDLLEDVSSGSRHPKLKPQPSGRILPQVKSFIYHHD